MFQPTYLLTRPFLSPVSILASRVLSIHVPTWDRVDLQERPKSAFHPPIDRPTYLPTYPPTWDRVALPPPLSRTYPPPPRVSPIHVRTHLGPGGLAGEAKVDQLDVPRGGDEEVLGLHVPVDDSVRVEEAQGQHRLGHVVPRDGW